MEKVDLIIRGDYVLPMEDDFPVIKDGAVAVTGKKIIDVGIYTDISKKYNAEKLLNIFKKPESYFKKYNSYRGKLLISKFLKHFLYLVTSTLSRKSEMFSKQVLSHLCSLTGDIGV